MRIKVAVIGGGSWGTTVGHLAAHNVPTLLWARDEATVYSINERNMNERYLDGYELHPDLKATHDLEKAVTEADVIVMGVPSHAYRSTLETVADSIRAWVPVVSLTKGLEQGSRLRMSQVINEVMPGHPAAVLTGRVARSAVYSRSLLDKIDIETVGPTALLAADGEIFEGNSTFTVEKAPDRLRTYAPHR